LGRPAQNIEPRSLLEDPASFRAIIIMLKLVSIIVEGPASFCREQKSGQRQFLEDPASFWTIIIVLRLVSNHESSRRATIVFGLSPSCSEYGQAMMI